MLAKGRREKTLYGLGSRRGSMHRYTFVRWTIGILATIGIALLPLTGVLRIDLWGGKHLWLGESVGVVEAIKAFAFPFLAINIAIILTSRFFGRWLCGFGCPIGNLNRLSEWFRWRLRKRSYRSLGAVVMFLACALLAAVAFSFWIDLARLRAGLAGGRDHRWECAARDDDRPVRHGPGPRHALLPRLLPFRRVPSQSWAPTRRPESSSSHPENCTDCHACENACPVDLTWMPREMATEELRPGTGFYPDGLSNHANCLRCGDCVVVCESTTGELDGSTPLRMGILKDQTSTVTEGSP